MANQSKKNGGILKGCLIALGVLLAITFLIGFGWIAGIIWLIFFRKKLNNDPQKQKRTTILVSVLSAISFIIMVYSMATAPPALQEIVISSDMEGQELEVGQDYVIDIAYNPDNANLSNLKYNIDGIMATFSKSTADDNKAILHTFSGGTVIISVSSGEIKSNSLEFNIVEETETETTETQEESIPVTFDEAKTSLSALLDSLIDASYKSSPSYSCDLLTDADKKEHIILSINLESSDFTEQDSCVNAVSPIIDGVLASEYYSFISSMDFYMLVDGQPSYILHVDDASAITSTNDIGNQLDIQPQQNSENTGSDSTGSSDNSSSASTDTGNTPSTSVDADMVWIDNTGKKYHSKSSCSNMDAPYQVTKSEAEAMGRTPCKKCY